MKLVTDRTQRNYNYLEIIAAYNNLLKEANGNSTIGEEQYEEFINTLSANLIGLNGVESITDSVGISDIHEGASLDLCEWDGDCYQLCKKKKILPTASREEALIVYSMLKNGDFDLMLNEEAQNKLLENISAFFENLNESPVNLFDYIEIKGKSLCADDLKSIEQNYSILNDAVKNSRFVKIKYDYNDEINEHTVQPIGFVYSQLDLRLRMKAFKENGECWTFYLSNIKEIRFLEEAPFEPFSETNPKMKELVFSFENIHNRAERVAARFSDYEKTVKFKRKKNIITYTVYYPDTMTENNRIFFRLRSLGKGISIKSEEKERVRADAQKALANYKSGTKNEKQLLP